MGGLSDSSTEAPCSTISAEGSSPQTVRNEAISPAGFSQVPRSRVSRIHSPAELEAIYALILFHYHGQYSHPAVIAAFEEVERLKKEGASEELEEELQVTSKGEELDKVEAWLASLPRRNDPVSAWEPVLRRLGLTHGEYVAAEVRPGKAPQKGSPGRRKDRSNRNMTPTWNFLIYTLLSRVPGERLKLHHLYMLCIAWCPGLGPDNKKTNGNCRHNLQTSAEFVQDPEKSSDPGDWHRIATIEEYEETRLQGRQKKLIMDSTSPKSQESPQRPKKS